MRSATNNPFNPGFGDADVWVERIDQLGVVRAMLDRATNGARQAPRLIEQERGYGKTTLLAAVADLAPTWHPDALVVRVSAVDGETFTTAFASRLLRTLERSPTTAGVATRVARSLARVRQVRLAGVVGLDLADDTVDQPPSLALEDALMTLGRAARHELGDAPIVLLIDEAHVIDAQSRRAVFNALQAAINQAEGDGRVLPFVVLLAGLPGLRSRFKSDKVTFGERCRELALDRLDDEAMRDTLLRFEQFNDAGVRFAPDAIEHLIDVCDGHPHVFQLVGEGAWDASPRGEHVTVADVDTGLATSQRERAAIVAARLAGLSDAQTRWLAAAASLDDEERTLTAICRRYRDDEHATAARCGSLGRAMLEAGAVRHAPTGSTIEFALRGMREHLRGEPF